MLYYNLKFLAEWLGLEPRIRFNTYDGLAIRSDTITAPLHITKFFTKDQDVSWHFQDMTQYEPFLQGSLNEQHIQEV